MYGYNGVEPQSKGERYAKKMPQKGVGLFFSVLFSHFNKVLLANAVFLLFSIPIVTIPAALTALNRIYIVLLNDGYVEVWKDFLKEFKASFLNSLLLGIAFGASMALFYIAARVYPQLVNSTQVQTIVFSIASALMIITCVIFSYAFAMNAQFKLRVRDIIKNSALMSVLCIKNSLVLALLSIAFNFVAIYFFPKSLPIMLTLFMAVYQLAVYIAVREPFKKYLMPKPPEEE